MGESSSAARVLERLTEHVAVAVDSTQQLVVGVDQAIEDYEQDRLRKWEVRAERAEEGNRRRPQRPTRLRRKEGRTSIPERELGPTLEVTYLDILHYLARGLSLSRTGAMHGSAEHWGSLKYLRALQALQPGLFNDAPYLALSPQARALNRRYKELQSGELGMGLALALVDRILRRRHPDRHVSLIHAETVLSDGWTLRKSGRNKERLKRAGYEYYPDFLAEVWKPGKASMVYSIHTKGTHSPKSYSLTQLGTSAAHIDGFHVGHWDETPGFVFSTQLPRKGPLIIRALQTPRSGGLLLLPDGTVTAENLDVPVPRPTLPSGITRPHQDGKRTLSLRGSQVRPEHLDWFQQVLARTDAAGLTAFAGVDAATASLLTPSQGREDYETYEHVARRGSDQVEVAQWDAEHPLLGEDFAGTDHVFRRDGLRLEAFSGVRTDILEQLAKKEGHSLHGARLAIDGRSLTQRTTTNDPHWHGPVSLHPDGTVLALRVMEAPTCRANPPCR